MHFSIIKKIFDWLTRYIHGQENLRRTINRWVIQNELKQRRTELRGYPLHAYIDICNICNLRCPLCPTGQGRNERKKEKMTIQAFQRIMSQIGQYIYSVRLDSWGEPLLNKDIYKMIRCARGYGINVSFSTNLNILTPDDAEQLVKSGLSGILISLDGVTQTTYETYRRGGDLETVKNNIRLIQRTKLRLKQTTPAITLLYLVMRHNENEIESARRLAKEMGAGISIGPIRVDTGREILSPLPELIEQAQQWLPQDEQYRRYDTIGKKANRVQNICEIPWTQITINPDGSVSPCCAVYPEMYDFGNILETPFRDIWNGESYRSARSLFTTGSPQGLCRTVCHICKGNGLLSA